MENRSQWIYEQHEAGRTLQDIANELSLSMITVIRHYESVLEDPEGKPQDHIAHLGLSTPTFRALRIGNILSISDLLSFLMASDNKQIRGISPSRKNECMIALYKKGVLDKSDVMPVYSFLPIHIFDIAIDYWDHQCAVCGREFTDDVRAVQDHFIPKASACFPGSDPTNIIPMCTSCNMSKLNNDPLLFLVRRLGHWEGLEKMREIVIYFEWWRRKLYD